MPVDRCNVSLRNFFLLILVITTLLFIALNTRIQRVLDDTGAGQLQLIIEFPSMRLFDNAPIQFDTDDDDDDDFLIINNMNSDPNAPNTHDISNLNLQINAQLKAVSTNSDQQFEVVQPQQPQTPQQQQSQSQSQSQQLTPHDHLSHSSHSLLPFDQTNTLFRTVPHDCIMELDCHLYLSDSPEFMKKSMVVIGMVRDSEKDIIATLQQLDEISCIFDRIIFIFYESNSKDSTPQILEEWTTIHLNGDHCKALKYNPNVKPRPLRSDAIDSHSPSLVHKMIFHDFVDVRGKNRIVRFIIFRNMLLNKIREVSVQFGMSFDYVMMIDLDIKEFDSKALMRDLNDSPYDVICANGLFKLEIMRDTFASVMRNGTWLYTYHSLYDDHFPDLEGWPYQRYEAMNSCFGGLAVYKSSHALLNSKCDYIILEDMKKEWEYAEKYRNKTGKRRAWNSEWQWYLQDEYRNELNRFVDMFYAANSRVGKERRKICEHLAYHYCLRAHNYTLAIAKDVLVYYFDFARMANNPL